MDFVDALRVLGRRWIVVCLGLLLTAGAGFYAITVVATEYQARAQYVLLLPSSSTGSNNPTNPYTNLNTGLIFAASLIASDLSTKTVARELVEEDFKSEFSIALGTSGGPALDVIVKGTDRDDVLETRDELLRRFDDELGSLQRIPGIPQSQLIFSRTNAVDPVAEAVPGAKRKALMLIAAIGLVLTLIAAFTIDGLSRRRSRRTGETGETGETGPSLAGATPPARERTDQVPAGRSAPDEPELAERGRVARGPWSNRNR
ncbi:hypothetical protein [Nocardioides houyundeii]|uniref:hypothetical protein n=1 Tax=Nocardioides houyundeii TaxID=2045452 RepID=UPI0013157778|nr:hypothetical protein [Nocardioides houyundeii]